MKKQSEVKKVLVDGDYYPRLMKSGLGEKRRDEDSSVIPSDSGGGGVLYPMSRIMP